MEVPISKNTTVVKIESSLGKHKDIIATIASLPAHNAKLYRRVYALQFRAVFQISEALIILQHGKETHGGGGGYRSASWERGDGQIQQLDILVSYTNMRHD